MVSSERMNSTAWATMAGVFVAVSVVTVMAIRAVSPSPFLTVSPERADALYRCGESVTFVVTLGVGGGRADDCEVEWELSQDGVEPKRRGIVKLDSGRGLIQGTMTEPGFLQCRVKARVGNRELSALAGAGIDPSKIEPSSNAPEDFDEFWASKKRLLATVPVNARITPVRSFRLGVEVFDVQADSIGAGVSGYLVRPKGAQMKSLPIVLSVHAAGVSSSFVGTATDWARTGALAMDLNAHGLPNGRPKDYYDRHAAGGLKDYQVSGRASRETVYFLEMYLRLVRALDVLTARPEWDGRTVVVVGTSQGGAQALAAAGLDSRVTFFAASAPAACDHTGALIGRVTGWPYLISAEETGAPALTKAARYFDGVNFAARVKVPSCFTVAFCDTTCPPTTVYAAYNEIRAEKAIFTDVRSGHPNSPAAVNWMREAVLNHCRSK